MASRNEKVSDACVSKHSGSGLCLGRRRCRLSIHPISDGERDGVVVAAMLGGDESAARELFQRYHQRLVRRMAYWTRDPARADDLAQDAWLKAVAALERFDEEAPFWPWLRCIGDNVARSDLRSRFLRSGEERVIYVDNDVLAQSAAQDADEARIDDGAAIATALGAISSRQRDAFLAVASAGAPMAVAAIDFGVSENAFRQLYHRARQSLRQHLEGVLGTAPVVWWHRVRWSVREALTPGSATTLAQATATVVGLVAVVGLAPVMTDGQGNASTIGGAGGMTVEAFVATQPAEGESVHDSKRQRSRLLAVSVATRPAGTAGPWKPTKGRVVPPVVEAPSVAVGGAPVRGDQSAPADPDFHYGVRVEAPGAPRQQVGYKSKDSRVEWVDEAACEAASSSPVTYCERER